MTARLRRAPLSALVLVVPGVMTAWMALRSGGYFPDSVAAGTVLALALVLVVALADRRPFDGLSWPLVAVLVAGALLAAWTLFSSHWSHAPARAILAYGQLLLYLAVLLLCAMAGRGADRARVLLYALVLGAAVPSIGAVLVWLAPDTFHVSSDLFSRRRLSWPTSYWNATALLAGLGSLWALGVTAARREPLVVRAIAAGLVPPMLTVLVFTASRGATGATVVGVIAYVLAARSRSAAIGLLAVAPGGAIALALALDVSGLNTDSPDAVARDDGHRTLWLIGLCALGTAVFRALLSPAEQRLDRAPAVPRRVSATAAVALLAAAVVAVFAVNVPHRISHAADEFSAQGAVSSDISPGRRLTQLGNNGRIQHWKVAIDHGFDPHKLDGTGAGTYALLWAKYRTTYFTVQNAHSLYVETLGELGIVGLVLLLIVVVALLVALALRCRGPNRLLWAPLFAGAVAWAAHASVDWDWQMCAVTLGVFAAGGLALGRPARGEPTQRSPWPARLVVALGAIVLAVLPISIFRSQRALTDAIAAVKRNDCATAVDRALTANDALSQRPEPYEVLGWCDIRLNRPKLALRAIRAAEQRDPNDWEFRYDEALIRAAQGLDPRAAARAALARNPRHQYAIDVVQMFRTGTRAQWRQRALRAPLPIGVS